MTDLNKKSYQNPQNWAIAQRYIRIEHNKIIINWFRVAGSKSRTNLRNSLLIYQKDTAPQISAKIHFFRSYVANKEDEILSFPLQYQTHKLPNIAQLAVIFRPTDKYNESGNYTLHIPHYNGNRSPNLTKHTKGNHWAKFTCKDGAAVMAYCSSKAEAIRVVMEMNRYVDRQYKSNEAKPSTGYISHEPFKELKVKPIRADYFPTGKKKGEPPNWRFYFR